MWSKDNQFQPIVDKVVKGKARGDKMHQLMQVLRKLQKPFKYLNGSRFRDIHGQLAISKAKLKEVQKKMHQDPSNSQLQKQEIEERDKYIDILDSLTKLMK